MIDSLSAMFRREEANFIKVSQSFWGEHSLTFCIFLHHAPARQLVVIPENPRNIGVAMGLPEPAQFLVASHKGGPTLPRRRPGKAER
eukprot:CAMPEP_0119394326 /NCGR_PEP_ID=MMETSP1334-20130426/128905_1 /TAXON_ID=127549 /ORGANISM="Calcidiscus leptoporus, Strain RCC1130" /LENGTH=86 /DNA_ID=CAMNT_0007417571 /DNA_START=53 /DNA_END=310 /DNA_ORIENTATION=+